MANQVAQLTNLVQSTATQTQYKMITTDAQNLAIQVNDEENRLAYFAQECPPVPEGDTPTAPSDFCSTEKLLITNALSSEPIYSAYNSLEGYVQDNGTLGLEGMLHLYSLWLAQSKPFFRAADSTKMQNLYDYWDAVLTQAANLRAEFLHWEGEQKVGGAQLTALLGNPDLSPPTTGTFQKNEAANQKLMFPPVPAGTVVSTGDQLMWSLIPWVQNSNRTFSPQAQCDPLPYMPGVTCLMLGVYRRATPASTAGTCAHAGPVAGRAQTGPTLIKRDELDEVAHHVDADQQRRIAEQCRLFKYGGMRWQPLRGLDEHVLR